jgi:hypothetical protein
VMDIYCTDCRDSFTDAYLSLNSSSCTHQICTTFVCQSYLDKVVIKENGRQTKRGFEKNEYIYGPWQALIWFQVLAQQLVT